MVEELILNNTRLIYKCIKDMHLYWATEDEWQAFYDDGLIGLINGAKTFDESKEIQPSTYLYKCIKMAISKGIYISSRAKRKPDKNTISLDAYVTDKQDTTLIEFIPDTKINMEQQILEKEQFELIVNIADKVLSDKQKRYFYKYYGLKGFEERNFYQIAEEEKVTAEAVRTTVYRSRTKIQYYMKKYHKNLFE
ncbi:MAG: sigma-70 family RNA polymerase sigma factor [Bacilli bacterium]|nr:sigma-70 family RNA polymerase sigma factor [Bacilli bacterium]